MSESKSHKAAKGHAAKTGRKEVPLSSGRRLDAQTRKRATEVERLGSSAALEKAARRLKESRKAQKILQVPEKDFAKAVDAMRKVGVSGSVKNMASSRRRWVR